MMFQKLLLATVAIAATTASCESLDKPLAPGKTVVSGVSFSRNSGQGIHYAECTTSTGAQYRVKISAKAANSLHNGQPCPAGIRYPMPKDQHPELWKELNKRLPYGGGNKNSSCGEWQTIDKNEARQWAKKCPPLKWGDIK